MSRSGRSDGREAPHPRPQPDSGRSTRRPTLPDQSLTLPRSNTRQPVESRDRTYHLRASEVRTLATVGAFRVVPAGDLEDRTSVGDPWNGELRRLAEQGLLERKAITIGDRSTPVVALTNDGKRLLDTHRETTVRGECQQYHAGFVKPRETAHDAQLYRLYQAEAARIEAAGGRVSRVVLDYELKRDYQRFLNRKDRDEGSSPEQDRQTFAEAAGLAIVNGRLELPDLRIEYESGDGGLERRDLELVTEHYSRAQLAGKARAGFIAYRAAQRGGVGAGGSSRTGGTPFDPHNLEWLR